MCYGECIEQYLAQDSHFQFDGKFYEQINGVAMGSPLGPLFAYVFMSSFEPKHIKQLRELGVNFWQRYVDEIFATIDCSDEAEEILKFLNAQHPSIRFTIEH